MPKSSDHTPAVLALTRDLLSQIGFGPEIIVSVNYSEADDLYQVLLQSKEPSLLIGYHGETLSSLQLLLGQHLHAQLGDWLNITVNVNDYRERRETALVSLADSAVSRVIATGQPHSLPPMPASERRLIHMYLADHPNVTTASDGAGRSRSIIISPKQTS